MSETTLRPCDYNGHMPRCPYPRSFSKITCQYSVHLDYATFTELIDGLIDLWDRVEANGATDGIGDGFEALLDMIKAMQDWTGWGGVPFKYTGATS